MIHFIRTLCILIVIGAAGGVDCGRWTLFPACAVAAFALLTFVIASVIHEDKKSAKKGGKRNG